LRFLPRWYIISASFFPLPRTASPPEPAIVETAFTALSFLRALSSLAQKIEARFEARGVLFRFLRDEGPHSELCPPLSQLPIKFPPLFWDISSMSYRNTGGFFFSSDRCGRGECSISRLPFLPPVASSFEEAPRIVLESISRGTLLFPNGTSRCIVYAAEVLFRLEGVFPPLRSFPRVRIFFGDSRPPASHSPFERRWSGFPRQPPHGNVFFPLFFFPKWLLFFGAGLNVL